MNEAVSTTPGKHTERAPGPTGSFIQGVMPEFNRDTLGFIERCRRDYGDVVRMRFLYLTAHFIYNPADIEYVLVTNAKNFIKSRSLRSPFFQRLVGNGLLTSEGEEWKRQRRLAQPAFHRQRISAYAEVMVDYASRMIASWRAGETRDIHRDMMRLTLEIVVKTLFNTDVSGEADKVGQVLSEMAKPFASQATLNGFWTIACQPPLIAVSTARPARSTRSSIASSPSGGPVVLTKAICFPCCSPRTMKTAAS